MGEPHPVGVEQSGRTLKRLDQSELIIEVERTNLDVGIVVAALWMSGHRSDSASTVDQRLSDSSTRIAECPGHHVQSGVGSVGLWARCIEDRGHVGSFVMVGVVMASNNEASCLAWANRFRAGSASPSRWLSICLLYTSPSPRDRQK